MNRRMWVAVLGCVVAAAGCVGDEASKGGSGEPVAVEAPVLGAADFAAEWLRGHLSFGTTVSDNLTRPLPIHWWALENVTAGDQVFIDLASRAGNDTYVLLYQVVDGGYVLVDFNDDCRGTLNSCLEVVLDGGDYLIGATTWQYAARNRATRASYDLTVHCQNESGVCGAPPAQSCGGRIMEPCPEGTYCEFGEGGICGWADASGTCQPRPEIHLCTRISDPVEVCGCDGQTYATECFAAANGSDVAYAGACAGGQGEGETCGGIASLQCAAGLECDYSENLSCDIADMGGVCRTIEVRACTREYRPVCGCDGNTYGNDCMRRNAGVPRDHIGECGGQGEGDTCGGIANLQCGGGLVCDYSGVTGCDIADVAGVCVQEVEIFCTMQYDPVCGCDGHTYGNDCTRRAARVALDHTGACE